MVGVGVVSKQGFSLALEHILELGLELTASASWVLE